MQGAGLEREAYLDLGMFSHGDFESPFRLLCEIMAGGFNGVHLFWLV
jgi:hypothetical protein